MVRHAGTFVALTTLAACPASRPPRAPTLVTTKPTPSACSRLADVQRFTLNRHGPPSRDGSEYRGHVEAHRVDGEVAEVVSARLGFLWNIEVDVGDHAWHHHDGNCVRVLASSDDHVKLETGRVRELVIGGPCAGAIEDERFIVPRPGPDGVPPIGRARVRFRDMSWEPDEDGSDQTLFTIEIDGQAWKTTEWDTTWHRVGRFCVRHGFHVPGQEGIELVVATPPEFAHEPAGH